MRVILFPTEAWAITGSDDQPCLQLRDQKRSTVDICFDATNRHLVETLKNELGLIERALGIEGPRS